MARKPPSHEKKGCPTHGASLSRCGQRGSVLFYIFIAVGLLAALTVAFTRDGGVRLSAQTAAKNASELYVQANLIRSAILECTLTYPGGGGDLDADGDIDADDNDNTPFPLQPSDSLNPGGVINVNNYARYVACLKSTTTIDRLFEGANNQGRFLPVPPSGFGEWYYFNDSSGVRLRITGDTDTVTRLLARFSSCQAETNYGACGAGCITIWINRVAACP
jgi:hypothetical protein